MRFNTGIAAMMEFVNGAYKWEDRPKAALEQFVLLLAPYAPHLAEEMWQVQTLKPSNFQVAVGEVLVTEAICCCLPGTGWNSLSLQCCLLAGLQMGQAVPKFVV